MNLAVIVQARLHSSRLPGKVLLPLAGRPLLERMIERVRSAKTPFELVVATTTDTADDPIVDLCRRIDVRWFRGHPTDLLDRHVRAAASVGADALAKIPSDCPLIDPHVIDRVLGFWKTHSDHFDFVSNLHPATYPDGNDVEVMSAETLGAVAREAVKDFEREHTTPFIWEQPDRFRLANITWETGLNFSMRHRWTIDYPEDYAFIREVYEHLCQPEKPLFHLESILGLVTAHPELAQINARYAGVNWYRNHREDLRTITPNETRMEPTAS